MCVVKENDERSLIMKLVMEGLPRQWSTELHEYTCGQACESHGIFLLTMGLETNHSKVQRNGLVLSQLLLSTLQCFFLV